MNDITQLAQQTITLLAPLLPAATMVAGHVTEGFLSQPGAKLYDWLASQFHGKPSAVTLERAVAEPQNKRRLDALQLEIEDLAEKDSEFRRQLTELLKAAGVPGDATTIQIASPTGDNNKAGQATGENISIHIE